MPENLLCNCSQFSDGDDASDDASDECMKADALQRSNLMTLLLHCSQNSQINVDAGCSNFGTFLGYIHQPSCAHLLLAAGN